MHQCKYIKGGKIDGEEIQARHHGWGFDLFHVGHLNLLERCKALCEHLTSSAGGSWREDEIMLCGPLEWQFVQLLQARLAAYDFVLVYQCRFSHGEADSDWGGKLRSVTDGGRGVFISDVCDEVVSAEAIGYERIATEAARG